MGIANLNKFLRNNCPGVFRQIKLSEISSLRGAVDISLYIFKYKTIFGDNWVNALLHFVTCARQNNIHLCFVYDTSAPKEKDEERKRRKEHREKLDDKLAALSASLEKAQLTGEIDPLLIEFSKTLPAKKSLLIEKEHSVDLRVIAYELSKRINQSAAIGESDFKVSKEMLTVLGVPWFNALMEAETTCADLCIQKQVDVVFSDDTDVLCYGAPHVISKVNTGDNSAVLVSHSDILSSLELTHDQFVDFCIMCGTDYNKNIPKIGPETAFKLIKTHKTIEAIADSGIDVSILNHVRVRELFKEYNRCKTRVPMCKEPNFSDVEIFFVQNNINVNISKIKKSFSSTTDFAIDE